MGERFEGLGIPRLSGRWERADRNARNVQAARPRAGAQPESTIKGRATTDGVGTPEPIWPLARREEGASPNGAATDAATTPRASPDHAARGERF
jgi:hypothetical protein